MKKRNVALVAMLALLAGLVAYGTVAHFSGEAHVTNVITTGKINIEVKEQTKDPEGNLIDWPADGITGVMPGRFVDKLVWVENPLPEDQDDQEKAAPAWVRMKVTTQVVAADKETVLSPETLSMDLNLAPENQEDTGYWIQGDDGYYYYSQPVAPGGATEKLFTKVRFDESMGNEYQGCTAKVTVSAQAVQVKNNQGTDPDAPITLLTQDNYKEIKGWPENNT